MKVVPKNKKPSLKFSTTQDVRNYILKHLIATEGEVDRDYNPCYKCGGTGKTYSIDDRCPIEGYKNAPLYNCDTCCGSGSVCDDQYKPIVEEEARIHKILIDDYHNTEKRIKEIIEKINIEDVEFLLSNTKIEK